MSCSSTMSRSLPSYCYLQSELFPPHELLSPLHKLLPSHELLSCELFTSLPWVVHFIVSCSFPPRLLTSSWAAHSSMGVFLFRRIPNPPRGYWLTHFARCSLLCGMMLFHWCVNCSAFLWAAHNHINCSLNAILNLNSSYYRSENNKHRHQQAIIWFESHGAWIKDLISLQSSLWPLQTPTSTPNPPKCRIIDVQGSTLLTSANYFNWTAKTQIPLPIPNDLSLIIGLKRCSRLG